MPDYVEVERQVVQEGIGDGDESGLDRDHDGPFAAERIQKAAQLAVAVGRLADDHQSAFFVELDGRPAAHALPGLGRTDGPLDQSLEHFGANGFLLIIIVIVVEDAAAPALAATLLEGNAQVHSRHRTAEVGDRGNQVLHEVGANRQVLVQLLAGRDQDRAVVLNDIVQLVAEDHSQGLLDRDVLLVEGQGLLEVDAGSLHAAAVDQDVDLTGPGPGDFADEVQDVGQRGVGQAEVNRPVLTADQPLLAQTTAGLDHRIAFALAGGDHLQATSGQLLPLAGLGVLVDLVPGNGRLFDVAKDLLVLLVAVDADVNGLLHAGPVHGVVAETPGPLVLRVDHQEPVENLGGLAVLADVAVLLGHGPKALDLLLALLPVPLFATLAVLGHLLLLPVLDLAEAVGFGQIDGRPQYHHLFAEVLARLRANVAILLDQHPGIAQVGDGLVVVLRLFGLGLELGGCVQVLPDLGLGLLDLDGDPVAFFAQQRLGPRADQPVGPGLAFPGLGVL